LLSLCAPALHVHRATVKIELPVSQPSRQNVAPRPHQQSVQNHIHLCMGRKSSDRFYKSMIQQKTQGMLSKKTTENFKFFGEHQTRF
jgi:hypothetical protein